MNKTRQLMVKHNTVPFEIRMHTRVADFSRKKFLQKKLEAAPKAISGSARDSATITMRSKITPPSQSFRIQWDPNHDMLNTVFHVALRGGYSYSIRVIPERNFVYVHQLSPAADADPYVRLSREMHLLGQLRKSAWGTITRADALRPDLDVSPTTQLARLANAIVERTRGSCSSSSGGGDEAKVDASPTTHVCIPAMLDARLILQEYNLIELLGKTGQMSDVLCPCAASLITTITGGINSSFLEKVDGFDLRLYDVVVQDTKDIAREVVLHRLVPEKSTTTAAVAATADEREQLRQREAAVLEFSQCLSALLILLNEETKWHDLPDKSRSKQARDQHLAALQYFFRIVIVRLVQTQTSLSRMMCGLWKVLDIPVVQITPSVDCHAGCMMQKALCTIDGCFGDTVRTVWQYLHWRLQSKL